tara:strand:- start:299 stop:439 length:141 start_codon:yes stop_codon:yes gene_type:complete
MPDEFIKKSVDNPQLMESYSSPAFGEAGLLYKLRSLRKKSVTTVVN